MIENRDLILRVLLFTSGMMLVVYGWRSIFKGLLDIEHSWARIGFGLVAFGSGLVILYHLFIKKAKRDK